jgi:hypothetical protein
MPPRSRSATRDTPSRSYPRTSRSSGTWRSSYDERDRGGFAHRCGYNSPNRFRRCREDLRSPDRGRSHSSLSHCGAATGGRTRVRSGKLAVDVSSRESAAPPRRSAPGVDGSIATAPRKLASISAVD